MPRGLRCREEQKSEQRQDESKFIGGKDGFHINCASVVAGVYEKLWAKSACVMQLHAS